MANTRRISTRVWDDSWFGELKPDEKLLFLYFLLNTSTNMIGFYEISSKKIMFDTGLTEKRYDDAMETLLSSGKVLRQGDYIRVKNFIKHQSFNPSLKKRAIADVNALPKEYKPSELQHELNEKETYDYDAVAAWLQDEPVCVQPVDKVEEPVKKEDNPKKEVYRKFAHLSITSEEVTKLMEKEYTLEQIDNILDKIENWRDNKKYKSLYQTALTWLKRDHKDKPTQQVRQIRPVL